jgi:hypothetical protein
VPDVSSPTMATQRRVRRITQMNYLLQVSLRTS